MPSDSAAGAGISEILAKKINMNESGNVVISKEGEEGVK
jgi:hypothetical protein